MRIFGWFREPLSREWHDMPKKTADGWSIDFIRGPVKVYRYENNRVVGWRWAYDEVLEHSVSGNGFETWRIYREPTEKGDPPPYRYAEEG